MGEHPPGDPATDNRLALALARRCADAMYAGDLASRQAGVEIGDVGPGRATARMTVTAAMLNGHGICHGGYVFLLADTAFAFACNTYGRVTVAQACDIVFVRPVRAGEDLVARATERGRYGRSGIYDVTVLGGAGDVVAEFRGRSRMLADGAAPAGDRADHAYPDAAEDARPGGETERREQG